MPEDFDKIFSQLSDQHFDAAYIQASPLFGQNFMRVLELALRYRVPTISDDVYWARIGFLIGVGITPPALQFIFVEAFNDVLGKYGRRASVENPLLD